MKSLLVLVAAAAVIALAFAGVSFAQRPMRGGYGGMYDVQTVQTVSGEVTSVEKVTYNRRGYHGMHLLLKTAEGDLSVHPGPSWFIDRQPMGIEPHDVIEVTGSRVACAGKPALIAAEVK